MIEGVSELVNSMDAVQVSDHAYHSCAAGKAQQKMNRDIKLGTNIN